MSTASTALFMEDRSPCSRVQHVNDMQQKSSLWPKSAAADDEILERSNKCSITSKCIWPPLWHFWRSTSYGLRSQPCAFYRKHLGFLLADQPNWWAAVAFYLILVAGIVIFSISPALQAGSLPKALVLGGLFGLVTYATYDLTNQATVKDWPGIVTFIDLCWGVALSASVSCLGYLAGRWLETP